MVILFLLMAMFLAVPVTAAENNYAVYVVPVRGREFWRVTKELTGLTDIIDLTLRYQIATTYLLQYDAMLDGQILDNLPPGSEKGLFLEVTPKLARAAFVNYPWESEKWERADKLFLSGYEPADRKKLVDTVMSKFKEVFGYYPESVGAWYIDGWSLEYLHGGYGVGVVLGVADQYLTDGYQVWGQYVGAPYYPSRGSVLEPALNKDDKIEVVKLQWAPRQPLLSYGAGGGFSNYSAQVNDYARFHGLGRNYLESVIRPYTLDLAGKVGQITLGIEAGELESRYLPDLQSQIQTALDLGLEFMTMSSFAKVYSQAYPDVSPTVKLTSQVGAAKIEWEMSPEYRLGILEKDGQRTVVDLRYYHSSCYLDNDRYQADRRQNLYRVVPAVYDRVGLGNSGSEVAGPGPACTANKPPRINWRDRIRMFLGQLVPDIRASKLEGKWVFGLRVDPEILCLIGCVKYSYPYLEAFLNLGRFRYPDIDIYARQEDQLQKGGWTGSAMPKGTEYGIEAMGQELGKPKEFENSYYWVAKNQ